MSSRGRGRLGKSIWGTLKQEKAPQLPISLKSPQVKQWNAKDFDFRIGTKDGLVIMRFGIPVENIGMKIEQAEWVARTILENIEELKRVQGQALSDAAVQQSDGTDAGAARLGIGDPAGGGPAGGNKGTNLPQGSAEVEVCDNTPEGR